MTEHREEPDGPRARIFGLNSSSVDVFPPQISVKLAGVGLYHVDEVRQRLLLKDRYRLEVAHQTLKIIQN